MSQEAPFITITILDIIHHRAFYLKQRLGDWTPLCLSLLTDSTSIYIAQLSKFQLRTETLYYNHHKPIDRINLLGSVVETYCVSCEVRTLTIVCFK
jgi:hypothetical protein